MRDRIFFFGMVLTLGLLPVADARSDDPPVPKIETLGPSERTSSTWVVGDHVLEKSRSINATDFGLSADSDADQSVALANAISHVANSPGIDTVYIPSGTYRFSRPIQLRSGVNLIGDGVGKTILEGRRLRSYLLNARRIDESKAFVTGLTLRNRYRTVAMYDVSDLHFYHVEFAGGIVRLEGCSDISLEGNLFRDNLGKSGYASDNCDRIRIVHNRFESIENGSINLSRHRDCYVAWNEITAESLLDSGYAGIRLPNDAMNNLVEHNFIENHGRGIFVLSSSENNVIRNNVVLGSTKQGVLIQSSANRLESNVIVDAGEQSIYVVDAVASSSPTPSIADHNHLLRNLVYDTRSQRGDRFIALKVSTEGNTVVGNVVSSQHGREFKAIRPDVGNVERDNEYRRDVDQDQVRSLVQSIKERVAEYLELDESGQSSVLGSSGGR